MRRPPLVADAAGRRRGGGSLARRQVQRHGGPLLRRAVDGHEAAGMTCDALHEGQAEAGALAHLLGREERLEQMRLHVGGHADAVVANAQPDVLPGPMACSPAPFAASTVARIQRDVNRPACGSASRALITRLKTTCSRS